MKQKLYSIKPFKWVKTGDGVFYERHRPTMSWGYYYVQCDREDDKWVVWHAGYCFAEYRDEVSIIVDSLEAGKQWCWEDWLGRITPCLSEEK